MNKKSLAFLIALSISTAPMMANLSSYASGLFTGAGAVIGFMGFKQIKHAKTFFELENISSEQELVALIMNGQAPKLIQHNYRDAYKDGISKMGIGFVALLLATVLNQLS